MHQVQASDDIELRSARDVFSALAGTWELSRTVGDWNFRGSAVFRAHGLNELRYEENGILSKQGTPDIAASRRYVYRYEAGRIAVYFDERPARDFRDFSVSTARQTEPGKPRPNMPALPIITPRATRSALTRS